MENQSNFLLKFFNFHNLKSHHAHVIKNSKLKMHVKTCRCFYNAFFVFTVKEISLANLKHIYTIRRA